MFRGQLLELLRLPALVVGSVLLLVLVLLVGVAWRGMIRLEPFHEHQGYLGAFQGVMGPSLQALLDSRMNPRPELSQELDDLRDGIDRLLALGQYRAAETPERLKDLQQVLAQNTLPESIRLADALQGLRRVLADERQIHERLLRDIERTTRLEFALALFLLVIVPVAGLATGYLFRRRIWRPLDNLALLLNELSVRNYRQIPETAVAEATPVLMPVYRNYNALVSRLRTLETEHCRREHSLQREVREATAALLDINRQLAASERMAAVGAVSAGLAHELRNPLAGIRMACTRLRGAIRDPIHAERLDIVVNELDRLTQLLNNQLAQARYAPEPATEIALRECVETLLSLVRYQIPDGVHIDASVSDELRCRLPVGQLRQALWNLVLNAAQAIGDGRGSITVSAEAIDGGLVLSVMDDGPGFSPEELAVPARAFVTAREGGTGLGLAIVQRFARELGGAVELENRDPRGACVSLTLPCEVYHA